MFSRDFCAVLLVAYFLVSFSVEKEIKFNIAHISDLFSRYDAVGWDTGICNIGDECSGGYCRMAFYLQDIEKSYRNTILLNTGNTLGGSIFWDVYAITGCLTMSKYLGNVKAVLGSRELMLGGEVIEAFVARATNFQYLGCNLRFPKGSLVETIKHKFRKSIIQIIRGYKVGIIGFTSETVTQTSASKKDFEILEAIPNISTEAQKLDEQGANIILVFGFASFAEANNIVSQLPLVDIVIVGGIGGGVYTVETVNDRSMYPVEILLRSGRRSLIMHNFNVGYSRYVGLLHVEFNVQGFLVKYDGEMVFLNISDYQQNEDCQTELKNLDNGAEDYESIESMQGDNIGEIIPVLDMLRYDCTRMECNLGNFVTDAILQYIWQEFYGGNNADGTYVSMVPAYALTSSINVTIANMADIRHAISTGTGNRTISVFSIKGKDLLQAFEEVAYNVPGVQFVQVAGLQIHYDLRYPRGYRVVEAYVLTNEGNLTIFRPIIEVDVIRVITLTSLLANGLIPTLTDKYTNASVIENGENKPAKLEDILRKYLEDLKSFKRPCIQDRVIVDAATKQTGDSTIKFVFYLINILYISLLPHRC